MTGAFPRGVCRNLFEIIKFLYFNCVLKSDITMANELIWIHRTVRMMFLCSFLVSLREVGTVVSWESHMSSRDEWVSDESESGVSCPMWTLQMGRNAKVDIIFAIFVIFENSESVRDDSKYMRNDARSHILFISLWWLMIIYQWKCTGVFAEMWRIKIVEFAKYGDTCFFLTVTVSTSLLLERKYMQTTERINPRNFFSMLFRRK